VGAPVNADYAARLDEVAQVLEEHGANPFRVNAYRRAAAVLRGLGEPVAALVERGGLEALDALPGIGQSLARTIRELVRTGRVPMLDRLRGEADPVESLATVPGIGRITAERLHHDLGIDTLEELEAAAHDGRLAALAGFGAKRIAAVRDTLAQRLGRIRRTPAPAPAGTQERGTAPVDPPVAELLEVDAEYRAKADAGELPTIAPRRFNPGGAPWLPVLHAVRGPRHYTAMYSNTPRAHALGTTRDWVILYHDDGGGERQHTVITAHHGPMAGRRLVRGREAECARHYGLRP
jgi:hypothetical protein